MLISLNWLQDYVDLNDKTPQEVADLLTSLGLEVEGLDRKEGVPDGIKVAKITSAEPHPNADSLQVCKVSDGSQEFDIVCGAPNARTGISVALATVGTTMPEGFKIKKSKIRGEASEGMLCSEKELGLSDEHAGIIELDASLPLGADLKAHLDTSDTVLELSITPNRADCLSYIGVARDLAAKLRRPLKFPKLQNHGRSNQIDAASECKLTVQADAGCDRFVTTIGKGLKAVASPAWMQQRLNAAGMRPINLVVDATNYVMLETGQPLHAYDQRFLSGAQIGCRQALKGESLVTLDGSKVELNPGDLVIHDGEKIVGLAGVMGGENSEVKDDTTSVVIEVAQFDPALVRKAAKAHGFHTEASHRFERGVDREHTQWVAQRTADLIVQCSKEMGIEGVEFAAQTHEFYPKPFKKNRIALRLRRARKIMAMPQLSLESCTQHLTALGFELIDKTDERLLFDSPLWRGDIMREIDLIEEVGRLEGFEKIPSELPYMMIQPNKEDPFIGFCEQLQRNLAALGLSEAMHYPFQSLEDYRKLGLEQDHFLWPTLKLQNPLSEEYSYLQTTLVPNLLRSVVRNRHHGQKGARLFQLSRGYFGVESPKSSESGYLKDLTRAAHYFGPHTQKESQRPRERYLMGAVIDSPMHAKDWQSGEQGTDFFAAKALLGKLLKNYAVHDQVTVRRPLNDELPYLHPGASAVLCIAGQECGYFGELHPKVARDYGFATDSVVAIELDVEKLYQITAQSVHADSTAKRFPPVARDMAFVVDEGLSFADFSQAVIKFPKKRHLHGQRLFDVYMGESVPEGKKSFALNLTFQADDKTLTDKEVDRESAELQSWLHKQVGASLRG